MNFSKYVPFEKQIEVNLPDRTWPDNIITQAPRWCAVDLRDGNQALVNPMDSARKLRMFQLLVNMGYKEIEVGFPAASQTDYDFVRQLIEEGHIPDDVHIQVLTQSREHLIERTYEALEGAPRAIVHLYNSTSVLQRRVVFREEKSGIIDIATRGAMLCRKYEEQLTGTEIVYQYSPESFTGTELEFAAEISNRVSDVLEASTDRQMILNLPATVEMSTPNRYADQIEWMHRNLENRDSIILSLHPHNDRGSGVAAAELGYMAGADRIEGCLFGNGERTGNVDLITLGMNLYTQGVDPEIDFSDMDKIQEVYEYATQMQVHERSAWAGELVFTAFSGSHQDAINKGFNDMSARAADAGVTTEELDWGVPYLPVDPEDIGRSYEAVIRVNSQSGKGGVAYMLKTDHKIDLPRRAQVEFSAVVKEHTDTHGGEITSDMLWHVFSDEYLPTENPADGWGHYHLVSSTSSTTEQGEFSMEVQMDRKGETITRSATGNGPISALVAMYNQAGIDIRVLDYAEHALTEGGEAMAAAYVEAAIGERILWGIGLDYNTSTASLQAVTSAVNRYLRDEEVEEATE
ncbi:MAG: 2-isopropylmalate synthase [Yaniella sp.]|uniref:2-isopropylmalate synthase n=1 Tax=Yaniella sp. TaxID=2773929 RepID=UPI0026499BC4|nr:2-isopropylmalate synthase [Yaniella sp.]MDN5730543.1 2-isopropylmalate synthase [Yaniella sp.]MDN5814678.1 2-isopropylmalate synthase [Yaniella sp.]MDN5817052.1 2-isopropylmalate synthase [Yaniella sp.]MDN5837239.1 2-isopropylmalate synthase [Yaniella sp.]MDN5888822.1 2-isopropylmalate synthase [Yaniella sp.]